MAAHWTQEEKAAYKKVLKEILVKLEAQSETEEQLEYIEDQVRSLSDSYDWVSNLISGERVD